MEMNAPKSSPWFETPGEDGNVYRVRIQSIDYNYRGQEDLAITAFLRIQKRCLMGFGLRRTVWEIFIGKQAMVGDHSFSDVYVLDRALNEGHALNLHLIARMLQGPREAISDLHRHLLETIERPDGLLQPA